ncbi:MAG: phage portal protein [FCB group bacterium]|nr:phage portal protein [FCB group bacterium]
MGGFGETKAYDMDHWTLRARSAQLYRENTYARGLISRLLTNVINTGLTLEATPDEEILGFEPYALADWSETVENRFGVYAKTLGLCDYQDKRTFGALQRQIELEAFVSGDVLVVLHIDAATGLPKIQMVSGGVVKSPHDGVMRTNKIKHGVELDKRGRQVAYWVEQEDNTYKRIPAWGPRSGRRVAWLVYGNDTRLDEVRGEPLLSIILQSLKEVDRYKDAALRKANLNAILAMFIKQGEDKLGSLGMGGGATRKDTLEVTDGDGSARTVQMDAFGQPGLILNSLAPGEEPTPHSTAGTDVNFAPFEAAMINAIAWSYEVPPEILTLAFSNNYSASAAAINEFKMFLNWKRTQYGESLPQIIYTEWFTSEVLSQRIEARGFLESLRDPSKYDIYGAWLLTDWSGAIKPSTDILKQANGYQKMTENGWVTNARACRELTGMKHSKVMAQLARENQLKAAAARPMLELQKEFGTQDTEAALRVVNDIAATVHDIAEGAQENG